MIGEILIVISQSAKVKEVKKKKKSKERGVKLGIDT